MSKQIVLSALILLVSLSAFAAGEPQAAQAAPKAPRLTIVEPVKDFGTVAKGDKLDWSFTIKNTGNADLEILAAKPSCGCTVADFDKVIKPGQTGKVTAHVDTTAFAGPIAKAVTVESNDTSAPSAQLTIHAVVKPYVEAHPGGFVRFMLLQGEADTQALTIYSEETEPFEIVRVDVPQTWIKADFKKIEDPAAIVPGVGRPNQNQYRLAITAGGPDAKIGPLAEKVRIVTNSQHQPEFFISVTGMIRPSVLVDPYGVNFGEILPNDAAGTRAIVLRSGNLKTPETFVVSKAESSIPSIHATVTPAANKGEYQVTLRVDETARPGDINGTVKIYTNDAVNPVVTVPVRGTIKGTPPPVK